MNKSQREQAEARGLGRVKRVIHTATILHNGWEMDNEGWIVELDDGNTAAMTTSHGSVYPWIREESEEKLAETERSSASIRQALAMWPSALDRAAPGGIV